MKERYQTFQCYWLDFKLCEFRKSNAFEKLWRENQVNKPLRKFPRPTLTDLLLLCTVAAPEVAMQGKYQLPHPI